MTRHPIADDCSEFANLDCKAAIIPWRETQSVFIHADLSAVIAWIKSAIQSGLCKEVDLRAKLRVEEQRPARIEKCVDITVDEVGRRLLKVINFQIEGAAQSCL